MMNHTSSHNRHAGYSTVELLVAIGLSAFIIFLTTQPIVQLKSAEKKVEFQYYMATAHQVALQKSRNTTFLKDPSVLNIVPGNAADQCFGGRGTGCDAFAITGWKNIQHTETKFDNYSTASDVSIKVLCSPTSCTQVQIQIVTQPADTEKRISTKPISAQFSIPAAALSSRQEVDFSKCVGKVITGINYQTLTAECAAVGTNSCSGIAGAGPMVVFGPGTSLTDPSNCQVPVDTTCANGMGTFGMMSSQTKCAPPPVCKDPLSTKCGGPPPTVPCIPNWGPDPSTVCDGQSFTQTDSNAACTGNAPRSSVGTNASVCTVNNCTYAGTLKWPDPIAGPCSNSAISLSTAAGANSGGISNDNLGYVGTYSVNCQNNFPAPNTFDWASASKSCAPVKCSSVASSLQWSPSAIYDGSAGPWPCSGPGVITQASAQPPGDLLSKEADASAVMTYSNSAPSAVSGSVTATCSDPGPVGIARTGKLKYSAPNCNPTVVTTTTLPASYCIYKCIDNFVDGASGMLMPGETSTDTCKIAPAMLTKFSMGCQGYGGASCTLTNPSGPMSQAVCSASAAASCPDVPSSTGPMLPPGSTLDGAQVFGNVSGYDSGQPAYYAGYSSAADGQTSNEAVTTGWCDVPFANKALGCGMHSTPAPLVHTCHNGTWTCNPSSSCAVIGAPPPPPSSYGCNAVTMPSPTCGDPSGNTKCVAPGDLVTLIQTGNQGCKSGTPNGISASACGGLTPCYATWTCDDGAGGQVSCSAGIPPAAPGTWTRTNFFTDFISHGGAVKCAVTGTLTPACCPDLSAVPQASFIGVQPSCPCDASKTGMKATYGRDYGTYEETTWTCGP